MLSRLVLPSLRLCFATLAACGASLVPPAAHAAGWHYYDPECPIALSAKAAEPATKSMKFVAMQPKKNIDRVCDALPDTGATVIVLDAPDSELRDMIWDIRVLKDGDDAHPVMQVPPQKYPNGMVNFDANIVDAGKYVLAVKLASGDGKSEYSGRHPFTVGLIDDAEFYAYVVFGCFLAVVGGGVGFTLLRKRRAAGAA